MSIQQKPKRVPKFKTYGEEAAFWDAHSPEEFPEEFEDVEAEFLWLVKGEGGLQGRRELVNVLSGLADDERQALAMVLLGLTAGEISKVTGWSENQCRRALDRARQRAGRLMRR